VEARVIGRGALAGLLAGVLSFVFTRIFVEPLIDKSIDYETGRGEILNALRSAAGLPTEAEGPEIFSRSFQSTIGVATGLIAISVAFGALVAVAFILLDGRFSIRPRVLAWWIAAFGFLGFFLLPFVKYPANPPAVGHEFTIVPRTQLYLTMVVASLVLLAGAVYLARRLSKRWGTGRAVLASGLAFLVVFGVLLAWLPPLGDLASNVASQHDLGFAKATTETPQPITNTLGSTLTVDGKTYAAGQLVYPGFDADLLWRFRWYSLLNQVIIWGTIGIAFGLLMERLLRRASGVPEAAGESRTTAPA
jgi:hypothetical protein